MEEGDGLKSKGKGIPVDDDERREAALAVAAPLQPTFKPPLGVSQQQLAKFQELHQRRLLIKSKTKNHDESQEKKGKHPRKAPDTKNCIPANLDKTLVDEKCGPVSVHNNELDANASLQSDDGSTHHVSKKLRQKLHWGLDTKDRWEMKANM